MSANYHIFNQEVHYVFTLEVHADPGSFRQIGPCGPVAVDDARAYWGLYSFSADSKTLTCLLPGLLYKDETSVYVYGAKLGYAQPASFKVLEQVSTGLAFAADDTFGFIFESLTGDFLTQTECLQTNAVKLKKVLRTTRVALTNDAPVWLEQIKQTITPNPDQHIPEREETAMLLKEGKCWLETRQRVPCQPASFQPVSEATGRDYHHFFWGRFLLPEVDALSVEHISDCFYKDAQHVFCLWGRYSPVKGADPKSFRLLEPPSFDVWHAMDEKVGYQFRYGTQQIKMKRLNLNDPALLAAITRTKSLDKTPK